MADFVQTMKDWRRMCDTIQSKNQKTSTGGWCKGCPLQGICIIDTSIKDSTDREFDETGNQIQSWAAEHPEPVYETWEEFFIAKGLLLPNWNELGMPPYDMYKYAERALGNHIPADIAQKLGIEPKEGV